MKYIAFFDTTEYDFERRSVGLSSVNVVEYMAETMGEFCDVDIISPTRTLLPKGHFKRRTIKVSEKVRVIQPPTRGTGTKLGRILALAFTQLWLLFYLIKHTKRGETVVSYHSLATMRAVSWAKRIKKLRVILEIREIYTDINKSSDREKKKEISFFDCADGYIFPTELLNEIINTKKKPYVIATGIYKKEPKLADKFTDGKIHVVYAGTFRQAKGGALMAIRLAEYLDGRYHVHILGKGTTETQQVVIDEIERVSMRTDAAITYDGVLRGDDFKRFLQMCHIGLSTQTPEGDYNSSSFPSKILTYMANGLEVLSIMIPAVESSPVGEYLHYYKEDDPEFAAKKLSEISLKQNTYNCSVLDKLHSDLVQSLKGLFQTV